MSLPHNLFAPSFKRQSASLLFTAVVGFMVFSATIAMTAEATLSCLGISWNQGIQTRMTIEIPTVDDESSIPQAERIRQVLSVLHAMPAIAHATLISDDDTLSLLKPWINDLTMLKSLPLPSLIDVEKRADIPLSAEEIQTHIKNIVPDAHVDDHAAWLADLTYLVHGLITIALLLGLLSTITLAMTVSLFCRAIMAGERETIGLLHMMGANDEDIARHFQALALRLAALPSFLGFTAALLGSALMVYFLRFFTDISSLSPVHWVSLGLISLLVPLGAIGVSAFSARLSVSKLLRALP